MIPQPLGRYQCCLVANCAAASGKHWKKRHSVPNCFPGSAKAGGLAHLQMYLDMAAPHPPLLANFITDRSCLELGLRRVRLLFGALPRI